MVTADEGVATTFAPCLAIRGPPARIAEAPGARSSVGRAPPSHGGGQGFESPRVHFLFVAICRLNAMIERRRRHALGLWCSNAARAEARTRLLHRPPSRASIVAFTLGQGFECPRLHRQKPSYQPAQCITPTTAATCSFIPRSAEALRSYLCAPEMALYAGSYIRTTENFPSTHWCENSLGGSSFS